MIKFIMKRKFIKWINARYKDFIESSLLICDDITCIYMLGRDNKIRVAYYDWKDHCFKRETNLAW